MKEIEGEDSSLAVLAPDLINIMESSILTFHLFLKTEKKKSIGALNLFGNPNQTATPLQQIQYLLEKVWFHLAFCVEVIAQLLHKTSTLKFLASLLTQLIVIIHYICYWYGSCCFSERSFFSSFN